MTANDSTLLAGYQLRLPSFEGPLDVLLRLIERNQVAISEVSLVAVTDQFIAYAKSLGNAPPETIAEFAAVATRLILLKSRSLLPRPPAAEEEVDPGDLVRQLSEYKAFREAALRLGERDQLGAGAFARGSGIVVPAPVALLPLAPHQPLSLVRAIRRRLSQAAPGIQTVLARPVITLREMLTRALELAAGRSHVRFCDLLSPGADRLEALTGFLAVLTLVRRRIFDAEQTELFGEIILRPADVTVSSLALDNEAADD
jgi:segregation and condensation protein A